MNLHDNVWNHLRLNITKSTPQAKDIIRCNSLHKLISMPHAIPIPDAEAAVDKERKKLETTPAWQLENAKSKQEVILEAQRDNEQSFSLR